MKAVVFHGIGDIRLDNVPEPKFRSRAMRLCGLLPALFVAPIYT
jgi:hypothetical protein